MVKVYFTGLQLISPTVLQLLVTSKVREFVREAAEAASTPAWPPPKTTTSQLLERFGGALS